MAHCACAAVSLPIMPFLTHVMHRNASANQNKPRHNSTYDAVMSLGTNFSADFPTFPKNSLVRLKVHALKIYNRKIYDEPSLRSEASLSAVLQVFIFVVNGGKHLVHMGFWPQSPDRPLGKNCCPAILPFWHPVLTIHPWETVTV